MLAAVLTTLLDAVLVVTHEVKLTSVFVQSAVLSQSQSCKKDMFMDISLSLALLVVVCSLGLWSVRIPLRL